MAAGNGITASVNGGTQIALTNNAFVTISSGSSGTLNSIWIYNSTGSSSIRRVRVDGVDISVQALIGTGAEQDSLVDSPTNYGEDTGAGGEVVGNYCTWNPLAKTYGTLPTIANGNLDVGPNNSGGNVLGTVAISSGKWYWEITVNTVGTALIGAASIEAALTTNQPGYIANSAAYLRDGRVKNNGSDVGTYASYTTGDVIGVALNMDVGAISFYKNNTLIVTISSNISGTWIPAVADYSATGSVIAANFGQRPFTYTAPSGFNALCTTNLPTPTIADGSTAMDVALYTGNGSTQTISGLNFSPDLVWIKKRSAADDHGAFDTVRGVQKRLQPNLTNEENTETAALSSFNSDGFTLGTNNQFNGNGVTYAAWTWDAGSSTVTNTQGSITSQVRANASAGFSVVSYDGQNTPGTVGHGLNAPRG
jgi:hypothetical protein